MRKSGRQRWQRSRRIPGFVRKISETTRCSEIDSAYHSLSLMQRYGICRAFLVPDLTESLGTTWIIGSSCLSEDHDGGMGVILKRGCGSAADPKALSV